MQHLNDIEALTDCRARIAVYREFVGRSPQHSLAWFNLAVDELDDGDRVTACRVALRALAIQPTLRAQFPERMRVQLEFGGYLLDSEIHVGTTQLLYSAQSMTGKRVYLRSLRDRSCKQSRAAYEAHQALPGTDPELVRAIGVVDAPDGGVFQVMEFEAGRPVGQLLRGEGPDSGFAVAEVPRVTEEVAATLAVEILQCIVARRAELVLDPNPDLWLRTARGVIALGPPELSPSHEWLAPEERDSTFDAEAVAVYRATLMLWLALTGRPPPPIDTTGRRSLPTEALPERFRMLAPTLQAATGLAPSRRPSQVELLEHLRAAVEARSTQDSAPRSLSGLKLVRPLGEGGFGTVYEALRDDGTRVAVKILFPHLAANGEARMRFFNEARIAAEINHPGIVRTLDRRSEDGTHYLVMELVEGDSLAQELRAHGPLTPAHTVQLGREIAAAVGAVHQAPGGIVHRDLKPANIMLARCDRAAGGGLPPWTVKICDFGIAKLLGDPTEDGLPFTRTGLWNGTPSYMAPEQWRQEPVDARTDVYALGCVLYECQAGHPPFTGTKSYDLLNAHLHSAPPPLSDQVPARLRETVMRMLAKDPAQRYADMPAVEAALVLSVDMERPRLREEEQHAARTREEAGWKERRLASAPQSRGFSIPWTIFNYLMISGGFLLSLIAIVLLQITHSSEALAWAIMSSGATFGGFFAGRASPGKTIIEPALGGAMLFFALMASGFGLDMEFVSADQPSIVQVALLGIMLGVGGLVGGALGERTNRRARSPSAIRWIGISTLLTAGVAGFLMMLVFLAARVTDWEISAAALVLLGIAAALLGGAITQAAAPTRMFLASGMGSAVIVAVFAVFAILAGTGEAVLLVLFVAAIGLPIGVAGAAIAWAIVKDRKQAVDGRRNP